MSCPLLAIELMINFVIIYPQTFLFSVMKRGADRDMASPHKRARNLGQEIRVLIPSRVRAIPNLIVRLKM